MNDLYDGLPEAMQRSVDTLLDHAATALWPERRAALQQVQAGIARSGEQDCRQILSSLGAELPVKVDPTEVVYRVLLTAYLQRLGEQEINNPDQAFLLGQSLDERHIQATQRWLLDHPEFAPG